MKRETIEIVTKYRLRYGLQRERKELIREIIRDGLYASWGDCSYERGKSRLAKTTAKKVPVPLTK